MSAYDYYDHELPECERRRLGLLAAIYCQDHHWLPRLFQLGDHFRGVAFERAETLNVAGKFQ